MNKRFFAISILAAMLFLAATVTFAQGGATQGPDVSRDPEVEKESLHNLEVARLYFKLRKAYVGSLQRCEEILAGNPGFARTDEVLYMAGKSSLNLSEGKGKQASTLYVIQEGDKKTSPTPEEFRQKAREYLSQLISRYPQSSFRSEAEGDLKMLGGAKPVENKP
jgi:outer membrane protein assembly factor BamD (BamD/ComL family)